MKANATQVINAIDMEILMHRDAHFGGSFDIMIEYYQQDGIGKMPDFALKKIKKLQQIEWQMGQNLSTRYLSLKAQQIVKKSQQLYKDLREVYTAKRGEKTLTILLSDLILSEKEYPNKEIRALVAKGEEAVSPLIQLLSSQIFYDPLYPGYGRTPIFAAECLAQLQDERAIPPLFEALGQDNFFVDEKIIEVLASFGDLSKSFLLNRLKQHPLSKDNEYAAIALSGFPEDEEIALCSLEMLEKGQALKKSYLSTYLVFICANLTQKSERDRFIALAKRRDIAAHTLEMMNMIIKSWRKAS